MILIQSIHTGWLNIYRCGVPQCGGRGRKERCKYRWCENGDPPGQGHAGGRGKLYRERHGGGSCLCNIADSPRGLRRGRLEEEVVCLGLCLPSAGETDRAVPCPHLQESEIIVVMSCPLGGCSYRTMAFLTEHREHLRAHVLADRDIGETIRTLKDLERGRVEGDCAAAVCPVPRCGWAAAGPRGLYGHLLRAHWYELPTGQKLFYSAQVALAAGRPEPEESSMGGTVMLWPAGTGWRQVDGGRVGGGLPHCAAGLAERCVALETGLRGVAVVRAAGASVIVNWGDGAQRRAAYRPGGGMAV